ncbi:MAG TPA: NTP transferase domain-containing protein [Acidimicrobiales bacterium]|nr:NTP transferase domain-containing protein [Acidimicrobiales bacterium]
MGSPVDTGLVVAVVLAGGAGRRLGGVDKAGLVVGGRSLLDRVLSAAAGVAGRLVVVGPPRAVGLERAVIFVQEPEPGGGPVPAVAAALEATGGASTVLVLAVDLPLLTTADLRRLVDALVAAEPPVAAIAASDPSGRPNPLVAAFRAEALREAVAGLVGAEGGAGAGVPAARLLPAGVVTVDLGADATLNVNTPADLARAEDLIAQSVHSTAGGAC